MKSSIGKLPLGLFFLNLCCGVKFWQKRLFVNKVFILVITYVTYLMYHASRKPFAVVKNTLQGCGVNHTKNINCSNPGYAPFNGNNSLMYMSLMDSTWAGVYSISMYFTGHIAEHTSLRYVLTIGLFMSGLISCFFGSAKFMNIHSIYYFIVLQILSGIFQSCGWPSIMAVMANWFGSTKKGALFGIWNSNSYVGNIVGQVIASSFVNSNWPFAFIVTGVCNIVVALFLFSFLIASPNDIGFYSESLTNEDFPNESTESTDFSDENANLLVNSSGDEQNNLGGKTSLSHDVCVITEKYSKKPLSFVQALKLPGVIEYALSMFFSKLVTYTFLFWLPFYISKVGVRGVTVTPATAGYLALTFDIGAIFGSFVVGLFSDLFGNDAILSFTMQIISAAMLYLYSCYGYANIYVCVSLLFVSGFFVCSPSSLIQTAVSTKISTDPSLKGLEAKATVAAILDGTGSLGAAIGPLVVNAIKIYGWNYLIIAMVISVVLSAICIFRLFLVEVIHCCKNSKNKN